VVTQTLVLSYYWLNNNLICREADHDQVRQFNNNIQDAVDNALRQYVRIPIRESLSPKLDEVPWSSAPQEEPLALPSTETALGAVKPGQSTWGGSSAYVRRKAIIRSKWRARRDRNSGSSRSTKVNGTLDLESSQITEAQNESLQPDWKNGKITKCIFIRVSRKLMGVGAWRGDAEEYYICK
jgi:hypothetical protein